MSDQSLPNEPMIIRREIPVSDEMTLHPLPYLVSDVICIKWPQGKGVYLELNMTHCEGISLTSSLHSYWSPPRENPPHDTN